VRMAGGCKEIADAYTSVSGKENLSERETLRLTPIRGPATSHMKEASSCPNSVSASGSTGRQAVGEARYPVY
jgi:hypothetical protein